MKESLKGKQQCILDETKTTSFIRAPAWLFLRQNPTYASFQQRMSHRSQTMSEIFRKIRGQFGYSSPSNSAQPLTRVRHKVRLLHRTSQIAVRESFRRQLAKKRGVNLPSTYVLKKPTWLQEGIAERKSRTRQSCKELFAELRASVTCRAEIY